MHEDAVDSATLMALIVVLFPLVFGTIWCGVVLLVSRIGGWHRLAQHYARDEAPSGPRYRFQSGSIGLMSYRHTLDLTVTPAGLYLSVIWPFRIGHPSLFIPRAAFHDPRPGLSLFARATRVAVGQPPIAHLQLPSAVVDPLLAEGGR